MPTLTEQAPTRRNEAPRPPVPPDDAPDGGGPGRGVPRIVAVLITAAVAAGLTYLGMLTQIWANLAGSQLPGA